MSSYQKWYFKKTLLKAYRLNKGKVDVLEWGSGGSTVYFTRFLRDKGVPYTWTSIEYNKGWYQKVSEEVKNDPNTKVVLFDVGNNNLRQRYTDMEEYIKYPKKKGVKYDVIFVDGRKRRRCLLESKDLLKDRGVVFLHDACRKHYQCAFKVYPFSTFVSFILWKGKGEKVGPIVSLFNKIQLVLLKNTFMLIVRPVRNWVSYFYHKNKLVKGYGILSKLKVWYLIFLLSLKKRGFFSKDRNLRVIRGSESIELTTKGFSGAPEFCEDFRKRYAFN